MGPVNHIYLQDALPYFQSRTHRWDRYLRSSQYLHPYALGLPKSAETKQKPHTESILFEEETKGSLFHTGNGLEDTDDDPLHTCFQG